MFGQRARKVSSHARAKELDQPERERASWRAREITREMARARTMLDSSPDCFCLISYRVRGSLMLKSQGLQNEAKIVPKRAERRQRGREEAKREQRSAKSGLESVLGALWSDILRFGGSLGEARWNARLGLTYLADPAFRRVWAPKVRKSAVR